MCCYFLLILDVFFMSVFLSVCFPSLLPLGSRFIIISLRYPLVSPSTSLLYWWFPACVHLMHEEERVLKRLQLTLSAAGGQEGRKMQVHYVFFFFLVPRRRPEGELKTLTHVLVRRRFLCRGVRRVPPLSRYQA